MDAPHNKPVIQLHSLEAEQNLLAVLIHEGEGGRALVEMMEVGIDETSFHKPAHQIIFRTIQQLAREGTPFDEFVILEKLKEQGAAEAAGGPAAIDRIMARIDSARHREEWMRIVREKATLRQLDRLTAELSREVREPYESFEEFLAGIEKRLFEVTQTRQGKTASTLGALVPEMVTKMMQWADGKGMPMGITTGFLDLDRLTFGMHPKEMTIVAARPSVGKTAFALNIAEHAACPGPREERQPARVLVFSLEMGSEQLAMRMLCSASGVNANRVREGVLSKKERKDLVDAAVRLKAIPIIIDDSSGISVYDLCAKARAEYSRAPLDLIIVDYLQLLRGSNSGKNLSRENEISEISRVLKALAKELNLPVMVLSQLNRDSERDGRNPRMSDLRESGSIEQDADVILLLARPVVKDEEEQQAQKAHPIQVRNLILAKQRNGPTGELELGFDGGRTRFVNLLPERDQQ